MSYITIQPTLQRSFSHENTYCQWRVLWYPLRAPDVLSICQIFLRMRAIHTIKTVSDKMNIDGVSRLHSNETGTARFIYWVPNQLDDWKCASEGKKHLILHGVSLKASLCYTIHKMKNANTLQKAFLDVQRAGFYNRRSAVGAAGGLPIIVWTQIVFVK